MINKITEIPGPRSKELMARRVAAVPRGPFNTAPIFIEKANGAILQDVDGNTYIDFAGGLGCLNVGSTPPELIQAITDQAEHYLHTCFHVTMNEPYIALAERLNQLTPGNFAKKTFFVNSGAEAVENAVKIARHYTGRKGIIAFEDAFHGRTLMGMSLTSKVAPYKVGFGPFAPEIYRAPFAYPYRSQSANNENYIKQFEEFFLRYVSPFDVAAVIVEPILGEGGFVVPPAEFLQGLASICRQHNILFIADEVQTGMARTGALFACERFGLEPDILITAKSLAGGLPLGSITGRAEIMDHPVVGGLGGTFGGNPLACRAALAALDIIEKQDLCRRAREIGDILMERFHALQQEISLIGDVRGLGAMCALELVTDRNSKTPAKTQTNEFTRRAYESGLITITAGTFGNTIRVLSPLIISDEQLNEGLRIMESVLREIDQQK